MICFLAAVLFQSILVTACGEKLPYYQRKKSDWVTKTIPYSSPSLHSSSYHVSLSSPLKKNTFSVTHVGKEFFFKAEYIG